MTLNTMITGRAEIEPHPASGINSLHSMTVVPAKSMFAWTHHPKAQDTSLEIHSWKNVKLKIRLPQFYFSRKSLSLQMEGLDEKNPSSEGTHQTLLFQGPVELRRGWSRKKRHLSLLNDTLVVSNNPHKKSFKIKHIIPLSDLWMGDYVDIAGGDQIGDNKSILLFWPMENFVATFRSSEQKEQWYSLLQRGINEAKEKGEMKSITLQIFTEDALSRAGPLYVTASNLETVSDIMKKLLPMLGRPNAEEDHQLWFSLGRGEASYPLTGQDRPFDIKMGNLRKAAFRPRGPRYYRMFPTLPRLEVEHLSPDIQGRFILKLSETARDRQKNNEEERTFGKRWFFKNRMFHRTSSVSQDRVCRAPANPKTEKLSENSPVNISEDGNLPTSILDMICFINEKGPSTEGIFRVSANAKSCRALREKLDSGEEEFLRNIPGSVLTSNLYDKWLDVMNEEEKVPAVQSLLEQMPKANVDLLRHLVGALYNIERQSSMNHMTAYNLSVCIAPSILCLPSSCNSGLGDDISKKVSLVQFLIENCLEIFGENGTSFGKKSSVSPDNIEEASGSPSPLTDSGEMKTAEHHDSSCPTERPCPTDNDTVPRSAASPLHFGGLTELEKPVKRRRSFIKRMFKRKSSISQNSVSPALPITNNRHLFGKSLMDICKDGNLPTTILDMLSVINEKGEDTEGIFRVSASIKSCRALREKLDSGEEVNFRSESPLVVASVLMDFIGNIQGSLLSPRLYDEWLGVTDQENEEQKISVIQSLLQQLPKPNVDLLRHLFAMLHNIKSHSSTNKMTAYSLSVCIAPSILSLPSSCNWGVEKEISRKISLVQFLLENCLKIFGEDITTTVSRDSSNCCNNKENPLDSLNNFNDCADVKAARNGGSVCPAESSGLEDDNTAPCSPSAPLPQERLTVNVNPPLEPKQLNIIVFYRGASSG